MFRPVTMSPGQGAAAPHHGEAQKPSPIKVAKEHILAQAKFKRQETVKRFKHAMKFSDEEDQAELDIDIVCPQAERIRSGMLEKLCGRSLGTHGAWKARLAVGFRLGSVKCCHMPVHEQISSG